MYVNENKVNLSQATLNPRSYLDKQEIFLHGIPPVRD